MTHPLIKFLATLPQFQTALLHGTVIDMRTGAHVSKYDGGDEPKHRNSLNIWWPGVKQLNEGELYAPFDGEKYARLQALDAVQLTGNSQYLQEFEETLRG